MATVYRNDRARGKGSAGGEPRDGLAAEPAEALSEPLRAGAALFDAGALYEAHEAWEDTWRREPHGPRRDLLQALIQTAVALLHRDRDNPVGAERVGRRALEGLARASHERAETCDPDGDASALDGVDVAALRDALARALAEPPGAPLPRLPRPSAPPGSRPRHTDR